MADIREHSSFRQKNRERFLSGTIPYYTLFDPISEQKGFYWIMQYPDGKMYYLLHPDAGAVAFHTVRFPLTDQEMQYIIKTHELNEFDQAIKEGRWYYVYPDVFEV